MSLHSFEVIGSLSTKTDLAPVCEIGHIDVDHVTAGTIISSFGFKKSFLDLNRNLSLS
ncbi:MAG: hypothetical protein CM15mP93_16900 [Thiotrichaceae bacterium]|nr:MAG: hypothetical protein CM15mP93_16900 [Thiotrichaceae bacterium]